MHATRKKAPPPSKDTATAAKRAAIREGIKAAKKGKTVPHDEVRRWLLSWGTENELPAPKCK